MTDDASKAPASNGATLTFRGGGWVIALSALLVVLLLAWSLLGPMLGRHPTGDGRSLESYGFDLSTLLVDPAAIVPSSQPRSFLPSRDDPEPMLGRDMAVFNEQNRPKYLVSSDRVLGIVLNGRAHAWPLSMLNAHEVVNDSVGGEPVAATYSPLCDAAVVFRRTVDGSVRRFEVSGLLVDSNLVFFDKSAEGAAAEAHVPSLFLQLERRAIAGPLAAKGVALEPLPGACITTWADWLATHPDTTVATRDPDMVRRMREISYARYYLSKSLEFPAAPLPSEESLAARGLRLKSPVLAVASGSGWKALPIERLVGRAGPERRVEVEVDGQRLVVHLPQGPAVARIERADGTPVLALPCLLFAAESVIGEREVLEVTPE